VSEAAAGAQDSILCDLQHPSRVWVQGESSELIWYEVVKCLDRSRSGRGLKVLRGLALCGMAKSVVCNWLKVDWGILR
jgi:hypothetical protein